jgi:hypothetical protein
MTSKKPAEITSEIVDLLTPLSSDDRQRVFRAALVLLGETPSATGNSATTAELNSNPDLGTGLPQKAQIWMKQNGITEQQLQQVFHLDGGSAEVIAADIPGKNKKEKTLNAYVLIGLSRLLSSGDAAFDDKSARALCISSGCYDASNHAATMKGKGNAFTGTKDGGWTLTAPGLKHSAELVKSLSA